MHEPDQHVSPIKNWKQLVVVVVLAFIVPIIIIVIISQYVTGHPKGATEDDSAVLNRIKPVGDVQLALASGPKGQLGGEQVYNQVCKTCHEGGLAGAPKVGDNAAWAKIIAQGLAPTVDHAIKGIRAMPPKGGNPDFENIEVERAVVFMANKSGRDVEGASGGGCRQGCGPNRRRGREPCLRQMPRHRRARRAEDRRQRGVDAAGGARTRDGHAGRAQGSWRHARTGRHGRSFGRRSQAGDRIHVQLRPREGGRHRSSPLRRRAPRRPPRRLPAASRTARRSTTPRARSATPPVSRARRNSATRRRGHRA